jgi:NADH dehydrogenase
MARHTLHSTQIVKADPERVWAFFSNARNLGRVTPRAMGWVLHTPDPVTEPGATIEYTIRPLFGVPVGWRTRIEEVEAPVRFRDVQEKGPYRSWVHEHRFTPVQDGVRVDDHIEYEMPLGPLGSLAHRLAVRSQLEQLFAFRSTAVDQILEPAGDPSAARPGTVAIAGGTGFVGGEIARELRRRGRRVVVLSSRGEAARGQLPDDIELRAADVRHPEELAVALAGVDELVISLAFPGLPVEQPRKGYTFMEVDAGGTQHLVSAARQAGVSRVVYVSGAGASHDAQRHWFRAKAIAEDAVRTSGMAWTILRPTWVYGPGDVSLNRFLGFARTLPFVPLTNLGRQRLAPVFVGDVARLAADSLEQDAAVEQVYEVGGPEAMSMREVIGRAMAVAGLRRPIVPGPTPLIKLAAWPMRFLPQPPLSPDAVDFVNQPATVDLSPLLRAMPRTLTPLEAGLATYLGPQRSANTVIDALEGGLRPAS